MDNRRAIDPTRESFKEMFHCVPSGTPVSMVNLVNFWDAARDDPGAAPRSGRQAYATYVELFEPLLAEARGRIVWVGVGRYTLIAPADETWGEVLIVEYPSVEAFSSLIRSSRYKAILRHRLAGVRDTRLIVTTAGSE